MKRRRKTWIRPLLLIVDLKDAVKVLGEATKDHKEGTLLQAKVDLSEGFAERTAEAQALQHAVGLRTHEGHALY